MPDQERDFARIEIPTEIDLHIQLGIRRAKQARRRRKAAAAAALACALLFFTLVTTIRVSPVMAAYIAQMPGMDGLVRLIRWDSGIQRAVENEMMQPVEVSDAHRDIRFSVHHILADESRLLVFYDVTGPEHLDFRHLNLYDAELLRPDGTPLEGYGYGIEQNVDNPDGFSSYIDFTFGEPIDYPDNLTLQVRFQIHLADESPAAASDSGTIPPAIEDLNQVWSVRLPIDKSKFADMTETIPIGETVMMEGQRITFDKLIVRPTRMELHIAYDPANTKKIFSFDDLQFVDGQGAVYAPIAHGLTGTKLDDDHAVLYFQSSYFSEADSLILTGSSARALDKAKLQVQVDLENRRLLTRPDDRLELAGINRSEAGLELKFKLRNDHPLDEHHAYHIFSHQMTDAEGRVYEQSSAGASSPIDGYYEIFSWFPDAGAAAGPVTLTIDQYPTRIAEPFRIRVK
jgi:hypothetical protein